MSEAVEKIMKSVSFFGRLCFAAGVFSGVAAFGAAGVSALAQDTQDKLDSANSAIEDLRREQRSISSEITDLNTQAEAAGDRINELNDDIVLKQEDISVVNDDIAGIEDDMSLRYEDMKIRIRYIYESGDLGLEEAIFTSNEFSELLNRAEYIQKIYDYDRNELEVMAGLYTEREDKLKLLEADLAELEGLKEQADSEARSLEALLIERKDELKLSGDKLAQLEELAKRYEKQLEEERLAREEEERKKKEEEAKKAKEEAQRLQREQQEREEREAEAKRQAAAQTTEVNVTQAPTTTAAPAATTKATEAARSSDASTSSNSGSSSGSNSGSSESSSSGSSYSQNDLDMMAAIIEVEAGDQPYEGRLAVGSVVMNRVESSQFPNTISGVIYQRGQFSPVASGRFAACLARGAESTNVKAAKEVLGGVRNVPYLYFRMHYGNYGGNYSSYTVIGDHILYNY